MRTASRFSRHGLNPLGWLLAGAILIAPLSASAQVMLRPADRPLVTAEHEGWYLEGRAITFSGSVYYLAGAAVFFNPYEMVRTGDYRGIPLYSMATRDPYGVIYVPVAGGLLQPYERRRQGQVAGTVGSTAPSFPVARDIEQAPPDAGLQAQGPPMLGEVFHDWSEAITSAGTAPRSTSPTGATTTIAARPAGPLTTALKPTGLNAFYIDYQGRRWFSNGPVVALDGAALTIAGEYHGFPVYVARDQPNDTIYVAVANAATGLLTPYSARK